MEASQEEQNAARQRRKSNGLVRRGIKMWRRGDVPRAGSSHWLRPKRMKPTRRHFHILALALEKMGPYAQGAGNIRTRHFSLDPNRFRFAAQSGANGVESEK